MSVCVCACGHLLNVKTVVLTTVSSFVSLLLSLAAIFFKRCLPIICESFVFCGFVCENEQIMKILFPWQVDVMKESIPIMIGLHPVSL